MLEKSTLSSISRIVINAFDVDINIYTINLLRKLRETSFGIDFVAWAENNPTAFMILLRAASATIQSLPKNDNLVIEKITDHLGHLPVDIWQTATGARREPSQASLSGEEFRRKYEHAVAGLSKEELAEVAKLRRGRLKEWIYSPPNMRTVLIETWDHEPKLMSKAIFFWAIGFAWIFVNLFFVGVEEGSILSNMEYEKYQSATPGEKMLLEGMREDRGLPRIPEKPQTSLVRSLSWRFNFLYILVFCPFYSFWVVYKAIAR